MVAMVSYWDLLGITMYKDAQGQCWALFWTMAGSYTG